MKKKIAKQYLLQSNSNLDSVVLAQDKQTNKWNRIENSETAHTVI